jgi:GntR family transcriptional regulator
MYEHMRRKHADKPFVFKLHLWTDNPFIPASQTNWPKTLPKAATPWEPHCPPSLENRKLVSRKKNTGTRVEAVSPQGGYGATLTSLSDLIQWAQACERSVQHTGEIVMDQALAKELSCDAGSKWLCIQSLRFDAARGKLPVSWTSAYIDAKYASILKSIQTHPSALMSELLEKEFGLDLATVEQDVTGCKLDATLAKNLNADKDEAALQVIRRYLTRDDKPVLVTVSIHPAKRFSIRTTLTRN